MFQIYKRRAVQFVANYGFHPIETAYKVGRRPETAFVRALTTGRHRSNVVIFV